MDKIKKAIRSGENQSLYDNYQNTDQIKDNKDKQAYWSPKTLKDTDELIDLFWHWYNLKPPTKKDTK